MARLKILVVDDEPGIRSGIQRILGNFRVDYPFMDEPFEFDILQASSGEEGITIISDQKPEIILLDNKLPGIQGVEVLEYVKKNKFDTKVVMITSFASLDLAVKATSDGAYDFIPKPFTPQELKSSIENITKQLFLLRMSKQLKSDGKTVRFQFLSVLSHELKAPLNAIEGYLKMISEKQFGENVDEYMKFVDRSLERISGMRNLILDLLDLTRLETRKVHREIFEIDLVEIARTSIETMKPYSIQRDVKIIFNSHAKVMFNGDPEEFEIVFNNLISNAIKYNKDGGKVECQILGSEDLITISVSDTGIGMTKLEMSKLFQDFVRIKNEKTRNINGSGLGLSIVRKIIESYKGEINVCSTPDEGSTFTVTLPEQKIDAGEPPVKQIAGNPMISK